MVLARGISSPASMMSVDSSTRRGRSSKSAISLRSLIRGQTQKLYPPGERSRSNAVFNTASLNGITDVRTGWRRAGGVVNTDNGRVAVSAPSRARRIGEVP